MSRGALMAAGLLILIAACGGGGGETTTASTSATVAQPSTIVQSGISNQPAATATGTISVANQLKNPTNRSFADQPDDSADAQIHIVYAVPADGQDNRFDLGGIIANTTGSWNNWLATQTGGKKLRIDTVNKDTIDVTFVRLPYTEATLESYGSKKRDQIEIALGLVMRLYDHKIYLVYYDGPNPRTCADAPHPPELEGRVAVYYLHGFEGTPRRPCTNLVDTAYGMPFAASPTATPGYADFSALHELLHAQGLVDFNAPDQALNGHVGINPNDLMYAGSQPWGCVESTGQCALDISKKNYYNAAGLPNGLKNLADSAFLTQ